MVASSGVGLGFLLVFDCCVCKFIVIGGGVVFSLHHWIVGGLANLVNMYFQSDL